MGVEPTDQMPVKGWGWGRELFERGHNHKIESFHHSTLPLYSRQSHCDLAIFGTGNDPAKVGYDQRRPKRESPKFHASVTFYV